MMRAAPSRRYYYIGNLPRDITAQKMMEPFAILGPVIAIEPMEEFGFGFIKYYESWITDEKNDIIRRFHGSELMGKRLTVEHASLNSSQA